MTISDRLKNILPVLSLDVYARGYENDMKDFVDVVEGGQSIVAAGATLLFSSQRYGMADDAISFYDIAYEFEGKIIISFRGTDKPELDWRAWLGGGGVTSDQALMALRFYNDVLQATGKTAADVVTTGHSLGGGQAARHFPEQTKYFPKELYHG